MTTSVAVVVGGIAALLVAACWSVEIGVVLALGAVVCQCCTGAPTETAPRAARRATHDARARAGRVARNVSARAAGTEQPAVAAAPPMTLDTRSSTLRRVALPPLVTTHPTENVLDACLLEQQQKRGQTLDAREYHMRALPNALRAAARDLTTRDPAIVPLDDGVPAFCPRSLGET